ncbi:hypothetical protein EHO59_11600 [Leptospira semungkisensis]|uniref:Lipoprotein n=1 Tax=Leptospira semungkisensis TaxID=2484985 RepID=A0A4R9FPB4_9LEPT|nr:hypothetical protein [Leptospira semungkisensis]TGK00592.1 hypothetical protein EHO59_11600 [Leptospira semungkisensis]
MNFFLPERSIGLFQIFSILLLILSCNNYSSNRIITNPPTIIEVSPIATGYELRLRAGNPEAFFGGYTLYVGATSDASRNPSDFASGFPCQKPLALIPNQPIEYSIEVSPTAGPLAVPGAGENQKRVCKIVATLSSGQYITLRSSVISLDLNTATRDVYVFSMPSNTMKVP